MKKYAIGRIRETPKVPPQLWNSLILQFGLIYTNDKIYKDEATVCPKSNL